MAGKTETPPEVPSFIQPRMVIRTVQGERVFEPGEVVETSDWRHASALEHDRRIRELPFGAAITACECDPPRFWLNQAEADRHLLCHPESDEEEEEDE